MFCTACGNRIGEGEKFCGRCGSPAPQLPVAAATPAAAEAPGVAGVPPAPPPASAPEPAPAAAPETHSDVAPAPSEPFRMFGVEAAEESGAGPIAPASSGMGVHFWLLMFVVLAAVVSVGWFAWMQISTRASGVAVRVEPATAHAAPGEAVTLTAFVMGDPEGAVTWSVVEGAAGGAVRPAGAVASGRRVGAAAEYTAPAQPGTYHVLATSAKDSKQASSAEIVVGP